MENEILIPVDQQKTNKTPKIVFDALIAHETNPPWRLIVKRHRLSHRIATKIDAQLPKFWNSNSIFLIITGTFAVIGLALSVVNADIGNFNYVYIAGSLMFIGLFVLALNSRITSYMRKMTFIKHASQIFAELKTEILNEIKQYETAIAEVNEEHVALASMDPTTVLTKEVDSRYGYMSPDQLKAYWREVELPHLQDATQRELENLNEELSYIKKEIPLLEDIK